MDRYREFMLHVHAAGSAARPDRVYATGVWQPYPVNADPATIARKTIQSFVGFVRPEGPSVSAEMQPEEVGMAAQRIATAMAAGKRFPRSLDPRLAKAAHLILSGKSFIIRSAGRAAVIRAKSPGSWLSRMNANPSSYYVR
jgi:hypothetical protein